MKLNNIRKCKLCNKTKAIEARSLCKQCYVLEKREGHIEKYPKDQSLIHGREKEIVFAYKNGNSVLEIAERFFVSKNTVYRALDRIGFERTNRVHSLDQSAFDNLNNQEAAYWLGFIYADGYVPNKRRYLNINLARKDRKHLVQLIEFLQSTSPVIDFETKKSQTSRIHVSGIELCNRLNDLGIVVGRKYFYRVLQYLPERSYGHFIRGFMDGDGYICKNPKSPLIRFYSTQKDILEWIVKIISKNFPKSNKKIVLNRHKVYILTYAGRFQANKVAKWIYMDATIFLRRKYENYLNWKI